MKKHIIIIAIYTISSLLLMQKTNAHSLDYKPVLQSKESGISKPLRVGVIGLVHTHVHWILGRADRGDIEIVGIVEPNRELALRYSKQHGYSMNLVFNSMEEMIQNTNPEAVTAFNTIYDHLRVVEYCAPKGIHVMVEKPLAVSWDHAKRMIELAEKHKIFLLTNYETSWYPSNYAAFNDIYNYDKIGEIRKIVFRTGHQGPIEIGCNPEFLEWLTDPVLNGGGALTDFGCYGANLATWLMKGIEPISVACTVQQIKPELYPKVEDEATIILTYPRSQVIIQASWNWPLSVKDMKVYGQAGYIYCKNSEDMEIQEKGKKQSVELKANPLPEARNDPFTLLKQIIHNGYDLPPFSLSSVENNAIVMKILELAKISAKTGTTAIWDDSLEIMK
ncbi:Gfo/Idh/MocA family oxidoreductase [uncultured Eudoraea sp.]|uniref:Gfo/Idh/MocA family protein n=1 Tax=uncultured Eudoraea sp. TaxID=1035614 RepID=UPI002606C176|nr:Gfo/Idh/MocA family oxidoreductase [uncultured Eudoraea sp.]